MIYNYDHEWQKLSFYGAAYALSDLQLQYDVIFAGDEHFLYNPLVKENLNEYKVVILPSSWDILDQDFNTILDYLNDGGKVIGIGNLALIDTLDNRVENPILESFKTPGYHAYGQGIFYYSQQDFGPNYLTDRSFNQVSLFSEALDSLLTQRTFYAAYSTTSNIFASKNPATSDIFMHIVNYNYDINTDNYIPEDSIQISLIIPDASEYTNAFFASPDFPSLKSVPIFSTGDSVHFTIPQLHIYDVAYISKRSAPGTISIISASPSNDTTVVAGELLELTIDVQNNSGFPVFYNWMVNGSIDSIAHSNSYQIKKDSAYEGTDTIKVIVDNGFQQLEHEWLVNFKKYIFPNLLFDESHNEYNTISLERAQQINPDHPEWVYFGILKSKIEPDYNIDRYETGIISTQVLNNYDALIISAPRDQFSTQEINDIIAFITNGGGLFFLGDCGLNTSINNLLTAFGIHYINGVIFEPAPPGQDGGNPQVLDFVAHEALGNNPQFDMNWGGSFSVSSPAVALGFTDSTTWRDLNWDRIKDSNEPSGPFTIVCTSESGKGRIFCIADNSLHDDYIKGEKSPNDDLFLNALKWLTESVNQIPTHVRNNTSTIPEFFELTKNYPNPFNPTTKIEFILPKSSKVEIKIYNMLGQEIKTLVDRNFAPGNYAVVWDGTDNLGRNVSSRVYLYRIRKIDFVSVKKDCY